MEDNKGTIISKFIETSDGYRNGPYKYRVVNTENGQNWTYLGKTSMKEHKRLNDSDDSERIDIDELPDLLDKLGSDYTGWASRSDIINYIEDGERKYSFEKNTNGGLTYNFNSEEGIDEKLFTDIEDREDFINSVDIDEIEQTDVEKFDNVRDLDGLRDIGVYEGKDGNIRIYEDDGIIRINKQGDKWRAYSSATGINRKYETKDKAINELVKSQLRNKEKYGDNFNKKEYDIPDSKVASDYIQGPRDLEKGRDSIVGESIELAESDREIKITGKTKIDKTYDEIKDGWDDEDLGEGSYTVFKTEDSGILSNYSKGGASQGSMYLSGRESGVAYVTKSGSGEFIDETSVDDVGYEYERIN